MTAQPKPKKCKQCGAEFMPTKTTQKVCSVGCSIILGHYEREAKQRKKQKKESAEFKRKFYLTDKPTRRKKAQHVFNAYIRARDLHKGCISCGVTLVGRKFDAGHYRSVGAHPELRFHEDNCHGQCVPCNQHRGGNLVDYRIGLAIRIGEEALADLEGPHEAKHYTCDDLLAIEKKYKALKKELET